ncbi:MAG: nucleoside triphosphate pyrophosphohydrolase [Lachnospiraceae bacterium]|nr:nucleoside triphosphate pyrophosphohydrolase [Lachnospiraceae bacterium]
MEKQIYTMDDFVDIIAVLRSENGCPWDKEQTHESLKPCMREEAAEVLAAIRILDKTGNPENLREELGDVLLQVVMHSQIAKEEGLFTLEDVIQEVSEKMIRRHPHVFGNIQADDSSQVLKNWEEIKKEEKQGKEWVNTPLKDIPPELPALVRAVKVIKKTDKLYEKQPDVKETLASIKEHVEQLETDLQQGQKLPLEQAVSEILWDISNLSRLFSLDAEQALINKTEDFLEKYE